ncbi:hypothetical protein [uncultured Desulfuromonas sp.]|uniref:hypothetical protein n=1 Tax=uncultured Desulfuromonas sp. TaxID=181013 RepID=UPI002AAB4252|nr:hypothetical protein [uncultured Desulfuromonas sp.]
MTQNVIYSTVTILLGMIQLYISSFAWKTKKPVFLSCKAFQVLLLFVFLPHFVFALYAAVDKNSFLSIGAIFPVYILLFTLVKLAGGLTIFNTTKPALEEAVEKILVLNKLPFERAETGGLLSTGASGATNSISTLKLLNTNTSIQYGCNPFFLQDL